MKVVALQHWHQAIGGDPDVPQIAAEIGNIAAQKRVTANDIAALQRQLAEGERRIAADILRQFGALIADELKNRNATERRDYVRLLVDQIEVGKQEIRISGSKQTLSCAAIGMAPNLVPKAERKWCTRRDSNPWPPD